MSRVCLNARPRKSGERARPGMLRAGDGGAAILFNHATSCYTRSHEDDRPAEDDPLQIVRPPALSWAEDIQDRPLGDFFPCRITTVTCSRVSPSRWAIPTRWLTRSPTAYWTPSWSRIRMLGSLARAC